MEDQEIINLFWNRNEAAIAQTDAKYGKLCFYIAGNILKSPEDCEECVSDTYLTAWNTIPPQRPQRFSLFLGRITRNLALKKFAYLTAAKRNSGAAASLEELEQCVSGEKSVEDALESQRIRKILNQFLEGLRREKRTVFLWRYWYFLPIEEIAGKAGYTQSKVKSMLYHMRQDLRIQLEKEGVDL